MRDIVDRMPVRPYRSKTKRKDRMRSVSELIKAREERMKLRAKERAAAAKSAVEIKKNSVSKIEEDLNAGVQPSNREDAEERTTDD